jgi:methylated-DNA-protein-cysteine methyltransferase related protein
LALSRRQDLFNLVKLIPKGKVMSYGDIGSALHPPVSGLIAGRWLDQCPPGEDIPWWRVLGKDGSLKIAKKSPQLALEQRRLLEDEGVVFEGELASKEAFVSDLDVDRD